MSGSRPGGYRLPGGSSNQTIVDPLPDITNEKFALTQVADFLQEILQKINSHDYDAIARHKQTIEDKLKNEFNVEDIRFGGSHSTYTDVKGLSDIDMLADLGDYRSSMSSDEAIAAFANAIQERLPNTKISFGLMAVTVEFSDGLNVQILPAFRHRDGYQIPDPDGKGWILTYPKRFARELTSNNEKLSRQLVPAIKLIKSICDASDIGVSSYHLSNLALNAFKYCPVAKTLPKMLQHFFNQAKSLCLKRTPDPSGQTEYVDSNLSEHDREKLVQDFARLEERFGNAIESSSLDELRKLFEK